MLLLALATVVATAPAQQRQFQPYQFATTQLVAGSLSTGGIDVRSLTGDIDGDGRNDLVLISSLGLSVDYAIGDGSYSVTPTVGFVVTNQLRTAQLVDLDRDGALDLLVLDGGGGLTVFQNHAGVLSPSQTVQFVNITLSATASMMGVGDVDGDSDLDVMVNSIQGTWLVRNAGSGGFQTPVVAIPGFWQTINLLDLDGDGDLDVILASALSISMYANNGAGAFTFAGTLRPGGSLHVSGTGLLDLDGDGDLDLVVAMVGVFRNNGNFSFTDITFPGVLSTYDPMSLSPVHCADFDGDGRTDVLLPEVRPLGGPYGVLLHNNGNGTFTDVSSRFPPNLLAGVFAVGDFDDDGDPDLMLSKHIAAPPFDIALANHLRQCTLATSLQLGQVARFDISSGPGFGVNGTAWLAAATGAVGRPFSVPGFVGHVLIDPTDPLILAVVQTSAAGSASAFVAVPSAAWLLGIRVWFEVALIPDPGQPGSPGLSNAVSGVIGP